MIVTEKQAELSGSYPLNRLGDPDKLLFFDIETTGLSAEHSRVYLIGCAYPKEGKWRLIQWFADRTDSEKEVLSAFFAFLRDFSVLVHFNGDTFDIPFLLKRCRVLGLPYDFSGVTGVDIYKKIKPCRGLLPLENMRQKSIERFLGIRREDPFTGGQLIEIYREYLLSRDSRLYDTLMLHNFEDLEGMPRILPILRYADFMEGGFRLEEERILDVSENIPENAPQIGASGGSGKQLLLSLRGSCSLPVPVSRNGTLCGQDFEARAAGDRLEIRLTLCDQELKYYYPDYQNYYYLVCEDRAVHKSVGEFVERSARKKATPQTCYVKMKGLFLPQPEVLWEPALKREYRDRFTFAPYTPGMFRDADKLAAYLKYFLNPPGKRNV